MIFRKTLFKDIRFWILFFFIIRLYGVTNPPLETGHNWRQTTGIMVARNFYETDANILFPRVDDNEGKSGIVGMEFPLLNYLMYLVSLVFGFQNWYGRLINLVISSIGVFYFFKILKKYFNEDHALFSSILLLVSIWFAFSRKMMPDTFCISFFMIGIFYGLNFLSEGKWNQLFLFFLFALAGALSKIPAAYLFSIFIIPIVDKKILFNRKVIFVISSIFILSMVWWWYFLWCPHLSEVYGIWYNAGKDLTTGTNDITNHISLALKRFYFDALSYTGFAAFCAGLILMFVKRNQKLIFVFSASFFVFLLYILKSGFFFYHHNYYIIPFVPVMCLLAGFALIQIKNIRFRQLVLLIIVLESIANQQHDFKIKDSEKYKLTLEKIANKISNRSNKIAINGEGNPQQLFFAHRKGWTLTNERLMDPKFIDELKKQGCGYIFINKISCNKLLTYSIVFENEHYIVYKL